MPCSRGAISGSPSVDLEVRALAMWVAWNCALIRRRRTAGTRGAVTVGPKALSPSELAESPTSSRDRDCCRERRARTASAVSTSTWTDDVLFKIGRQAWGRPPISY